VKKKVRSNNILPFSIATRSAAEQDPQPSTVIIQVGSTRFAMHTWWESLPPAPLRRMSQGTNTEADLTPHSPERGRRGPLPLKAATNLKLGRNR
jgi:hypothetical protein